MENEMNKKGLQLILNLDLVVAGLCFVILVIITFSGVIFRYFINRPILWQEEVQLWLFLWIIFFGSSVVFRNKAHVAIEMIVEMLPQKIQKVIDVLIYIVCLTGLIYLFWNSWALVSQFMATNKRTSVIAISNAFISSAIPIGCVLMILNHTAVLINDYFIAPKAKDRQS
jgi:TRAP-type C4-dicarboxylate transport system permease small subunit